MESAISFSHWSFAVARAVDPQTGWTACVNQVWNATVGVDDGLNVSKGVSVSVCVCVRACAGGLKKKNLLDSIAFLSMSYQ